MKKMKISDIVKLNSVVREIVDNKDLAIKSVFKFKLFTILKDIEPVITNFETVKNEKILEFGEQDENGNYSIKQENTEAVKKFMDAITPVLESDIEVEIHMLKSCDVFDSGLDTDRIIGLMEIVKEK